MTQPDPDRFLPLKHSTYQVLLALGEDERHGYGIMQAFRSMTDGREKILPGTLYAALARMVDDGLLEERAPLVAEASGGPKRRYYRRTPLGRAVAMAESRRLRSLLEIAEDQDMIEIETR